MARQAGAKAVFALRESVARKGTMQCTLSAGNENEGKTMTINDLNTGPSGVQLINPGLFAYVKKVMDRKTGTGQYGDWSMQTLTLSDSTGTINATCWGKSDLKAFEGQKVHLSALQSDRGWQGCMVEDRKYTDKAGQAKTARQIKASGNYLLELHNGDAKPVEVSQNPPQQADKAPQSPVAPLGPPSWDQYATLVRYAHTLALELEPDTMSDGGLVEVSDRSRARVALVNCILIAAGKRDFVFTAGAATEDDDLPF